MDTPTGNQLAQDVRRTLGELKKICATVDDTTAPISPAERWSPKEILSHLIGTKEFAYLKLLQIFLDKDNPSIDIEPGNPFFSEGRKKMTFTDMLDNVVEEYEQLALFAENLSDEQLARTAYIPKFKDSPLGENPTLGAMIKALGVFHVQMHTDQLREILQELAE